MSDYIYIGKDNIDSEHICCAIGSDEANTQRAECKKCWMKDIYKDGLRFYRLNDRGKIFVEYIPAKKGWKPISADGYMLINCLWVSGKFQKQGHAKKLIDKVIEDTKKEGLDGICVVTSKSKKPFLTEKKFYDHYGFEVVDEANPYFVLMVKKFNKDAQDPKFLDRVRSGKCEKDKGVYIVYANQCPFSREYAYVMEGVARDIGLEIEVKELKSKSDVDKYGSAWGTFGVYYNGELIDHRMHSEGSFKKLLSKFIT